jgi:predicted GNAT superfamily acetyltransferase
MGDPAKTSTAGGPGQPATGTAAPPAIDAGGVTLRQLAGPEDYRACFELQLATWGRRFEGVVAPSVLKVSQLVGGVLAGAFAPDGRLLGFVYGLTGVRPPGSRRSAPAGRSLEVFHWSHMLAVAAEARDLGLGTRLKLFQRELVLALGVETVEWTFDPLEARNAHLNFNRLGAEAVEYVRDMYKGEEGSELASGIGTDRFIVAWRIAGERAREAIARLAPGGPLSGAVAAADGAAAEAAAVSAACRDHATAAAAERFADAASFEPAPAASAAAPGEQPDLRLPPDAPRVRIEIPARIQELKEREPRRALAWRLGTRLAFETYLGRGYRVAGFWRDASGRCFYGVEAAGR